VLLELLLSDIKMTGKGRTLIRRQSISIEIVVRLSSEGTVDWLNCKKSLSANRWCIVVREPMASTSSNALSRTLLNADLDSGS
jgi:hypothetical protein